MYPDTVGCPELIHVIGDRFLVVPLSIPTKIRTNAERILGVAVADRSRLIYLDGLALADKETGHPVHLFSRVVSYYGQRLPPFVCGYKLVKFLYTVNA